MNRFFTNRLSVETLIATIAVCCIAGNISADELNLPTSPLITSRSVKPNMMLFIDSSSSMNFIVEDSPYDPDATNYFSCDSSKQLPPLERHEEINDDLAVRIRIQEDGKPYFNYDSKNNVRSSNGSNLNYDFGNGNNNGITGKPQRCFNDDAIYAAVLYANYDDDDIDGLKIGPSYDGAYYKGHFLNWYFAPTNGASNFEPDSRKRNDTFTRMEIAQGAPKGLIDYLSDIRVGLSIFEKASNPADGAKILVNINDVESQKGTLKDQIDDIIANSSTPLAEALQELGRYYTLGYSANSNLRIHPEGSNIAVKTSALFSQTPAYRSGISAPSSVTQNWCQQNFIVAMTDGSPSNDQDSFHQALKDYDGDCSADGVTCGEYDKKLTGGYNYVSSGSDYADDVILAMHDIDLRPDLKKSTGEQVKNNVTTYMVGFAEQFLANDPLMADMAAAGGGGDFLSAANSNELTTAFQRATDSIFAKVAAGSGAAFNTSQLSSGGSVYAASFNSANWSGSLKSFELSTTGTISANASWDAATKLDAMSYSSRNVFSYNSATKKGVVFDKTSVDSSPELLADLKKGPQGTTGTAVKNLINYLKGERSKEGSAAENYRVRSSALGDIANSTLVYVGSPELNWPSFAANNKFGSSTKSYAAFKSDNDGRTPLLYVGANDGMLHGFDAADGSEKMAYIPAMLASTEDEQGLHYLASKDYLHQFYVDLTPTVSDVYINSAWRTVLVGGLRGGGKGLFALDITDPTKFASSVDNAQSLALWEFSSADNADFGYSYSKPTIAMMENGEWAVIVGNGYNNSGDGRAKLFIIYLDKNGLDEWGLGSNYQVIETGDLGEKNGLSTPRAIDIDNDGVVDRIYAGDLLGNMWAFDVDSGTASQWKVAYKQGNTPKPLFSAKDSSGKAQPITTAPIVAKNTNSSEGAPNVLVFFGTGKYLEETDKTATDSMSYYAVLDDDSGQKDRSYLTERKLITSSNRRVISGANINWENTDGWYFDFVNRTTLHGGESAVGERVISGSLIRNGVLLFNTAIPYIANEDICVSNSESWLMAVDINSGKAPLYTVFDVNGDNTMDDTTSLYDSNGDGVIDSRDKVSFGGTKIGVSMVAGNIAILADNVYSNDVDGNLSKQKVNIEGSEKQGRLSWEELIQK